MKHEVNLHEELKRMKNLFEHERGVVISEQSKILKEDFDFNKYPCINPQWNRKKSATGTNVQGPTQVGVEFVYGQGEESLKYPLGNQTFFMKNIQFAENGDWYESGYGRGTFACSGGKIVFYDNNGTQLTLSSAKKTTTDGTGTPKVETLPTVTVRSTPKELKTPVGNKTGVQAFQDWLDQYKSGWLKKYGTLNGKTNRGYGKFGPNTSKAWGLHKDEYLKSLQGGTTTTTPQVSPDVTTDNAGQPISSSGAQQGSATATQGTPTSAQTTKSDFDTGSSNFDDVAPAENANNTFMFDDNRPDIQTKKP